MQVDAYEQLAHRLDQIPEGYPPTESGVELRILAYLFTPEQATLAAQLRLTPETPEEIATRIGGDSKTMRKQLKEMAKRGLIGARKTESGLAYALIPFAVGFYENQGGTIDAELASLVERYFREGLSRRLSPNPPLHRVIPIGENIEAGIEIRPYESAAGIVNAVQAWGVMDCICRKQKALIGEACEHPVEMCMVLNTTPGAFDHAPGIRPLSREAALQVLREAAEAGLVHSVSNNQRGTWYICNCCTCACGVLRGLAELGVADVVARSPFVNDVDEKACVGCGSCVERCAFGALRVEEVAVVDAVRCTGCGVCGVVCPEGALHLVRRASDEILPVPETQAEWRAQRAAARGIDLGQVL
jgi:Na+-translocating ferredoxin:NAD+ oxidoreductase subunit B